MIHSGNESVVLSEHRASGKELQSTYIFRSGYPDSFRRLIKRIADNTAARLLATSSESIHMIHWG